MFVFAVVFGYESRLQIYNDHDRHAMYYLYNRLCDLVGIEEKNPVREHYKPPNSRCLWLTFGWAFPWQMILLALAATVSAFLPYIKDP